jgi:hypothetical protein
LGLKSASVFQAANRFGVAARFVKRSGFISTILESCMTVTNFNTRFGFFAAFAHFGFIVTKADEF